MGWVSGFVLVILGAMIADVTGLGPYQAIVGLAMGAGVGFAQGRALRQLPGVAWPWTLAALVGLGLPFVAMDALPALRAGLPDWLAVAAAAGAGGLLAGLLQARILRSRARSSGFWVAASLMGWLLAAAAASLTIPLLDLVPGRWLGLTLNLAVILVAGGVLGLVTGVAMAGNLRRLEERS